MVSAFGLSGSAAAALTDVVDPGRGALTPAQPLTVVSAVLLLVSVLGFARTLQRTHLAAWDLPARGIRGYGCGIIAAAELVTEFAAIALIGPALARVAGGVTLGILGHALVATLV